MNDITNDILKNSKFSRTEISKAQGNAFLKGLGANGGKIWFESNIEKGTTFYFTVSAL